MREIGQISNSERENTKNRCYFRVQNGYSGHVCLNQVALSSDSGRAWPESQHSQTQKLGYRVWRAIELGTGLAGMAELACPKTPLFPHFSEMAEKGSFSAWGDIYSLIGSRFLAKTAVLACFGHFDPFWFKSSIKKSAGKRHFSVSCRGGPHLMCQPDVVLT